MKHMPRVATFLNTVMMAGTHTTYPSEKEEREARKKPKVSLLDIVQKTTKNFQRSNFFQRLKNC